MQQCPALYGTEADKGHINTDPLMATQGARVMFSNLRQNLRYSVRMLMKKPGFTALAVLTLALGIGATTAIFSVVYATLFEAMPYPKPEQLVMVWSKVNQARNSVSAGDYLEWKQRSKSFQYLEAWSGGTFNVATSERPEQIQAALMTP